MHIPQWIWFFAALFFGIVATISIWKMVSDVNDNAGNSEKFSYVGWYPGKLGRVWEAHRKLVPRSVLRVSVVMSFLLAAFCIGMAASHS